MLTFPARITNWGNHYTTRTHTVVCVLNENSVLRKSGIFMTSNTRVKKVKKN